MPEENTNTTVVDPAFITKLSEQFSHLPHDELLRQAIVYATLYWALFNENIGNPHLKKETIQLESGEEQVIDVAVFKTYLETKRRNVESVYKSMSYLEDLGLKSSRIRRQEVPRNAEVKVEEEPVAGPSQLPLERSGDRPALGENERIPTDLQSSSLSTYVPPPPHERRCRRSAGLEPDSPRVMFSKIHSVGGTATSQITSIASRSGANFKGKGKARARDEEEDRFTSVSNPRPQKKRKINAARGVPRDPVLDAIKEESQSSFPLGLCASKKSLRPASKRSEKEVPAPAESEHSNVPNQSQSEGGQRPGDVEESDQKASDYAQAAGPSNEPTQEQEERIEQPIALRRSKRRASQRPETSQQGSTQPRRPMKRRRQA